MLCIIAFMLVYKLPESKPVPFSSFIHTLRGPINVHWLKRNWLLQDQHLREAEQCRIPTRFRMHDSPAVKMRAMDHSGLFFEPTRHSHAPETGAWTQITRKRGRATLQMHSPSSPSRQQPGRTLLWNRGLEEFGILPGKWSLVWRPLKITYSFQCVLNPGQCGCYFCVFYCRLICLLSVKIMKCQRCPLPNDLFCFIPI